LIFFRSCNELTFYTVIYTLNMQEKELIRECLNNNRAAQHWLYNEYAPTMLAVCYRYVKSLSDAEDILQEGFIKVFTKLHQFKQKGELGAWIRRIMVNTAINYLQKHNRYRRELQLENVAIHSVNDNDAEVLLDAKDIIKLICELPVSYQTVFNLVAIEGYSHVEISKMLGINENTIRSQYNRARALLIHKIKILNGETEKRKLWLIF